MDSVKETLADQSLNAKLFSEADNRSGEHIDFRAFSDLKILEALTAYFHKEDVERVFS